jgi:hypothetical protein
MRRKSLRLLLLIVLILGILGVPLTASALPTACGFVKVTVFGMPWSAPGVTYCNNSCPGGVSQGPNDPYVWPVKVESYECVQHL